MINEGKALVGGDDHGIAQGQDFAIIWVNQVIIVDYVYSLIVYRPRIR